jgi:hypothetical protein
MMSGTTSSTEPSVFVVAEVRERRLASFGALRLDVRRGACEGVECGCTCLLALPGREFGRPE